MPAAQRPEPLVGRVFRARDAVDGGLLTVDPLRSSAWRRVYRGVYADARVPVDHTLRIAGARLLVPPQAVFSGRSAAHLLGAAELAPPDGPVEVTVAAPLRFGPVTGLRVRHLRTLPSDHVRRVGRTRCTTGLRTALDLARGEPLPEAVVALDVLLARGIADEEDLRRAAGELERGGACRARRAIGLSDRRAESQPESRLRVALVLGGLCPVPQHVVRDEEGRFVARVDLAFPEVKVAVEYDGAWHGGRGQLSKDRRRLNALVRAGWQVLHVTAADMHDQDRLVGAVRDLVVAAGSRETGLRTAAVGPASPNSG